MAVKVEEISKKKPVVTKKATPAKKVAPRIVKKPPAPVVAEKTPVDAMSFAMMIANEKKRQAQTEDQSRDLIHLSRRPTTREKGSKTEQFPAKDLKEFQKRLLAARDAALNGVDAMRATGFNEAEDHESDGGDGTNQTLRLQALGQMGQINSTIQQIDEALHRIEDGSYGVCTMCGELIRKPRLMNQPFVLTCMECQRILESNRG